MIAPETTSERVGHVAQEANHHAPGAHEGDEYEKRRIEMNQEEPKKDF